jgi:hypothetical protein
MKIPPLIAYILPPTLAAPRADLPVSMLASLPHESPCVAADAVVGNVAAQKTIRKARATAVADRILSLHREVMPGILSTTLSAVVLYNASF